MTSWARVKCRTRNVSRAFDEINYRKIINGKLQDMEIWHVKMQEMDRGNTKRKSEKCKIKDINIV